MKLRAVALTCVVVAPVALVAHASNEPYALTLLLDGVESGSVRSATISSGPKKTLTITTDQPTRPLLSTVRAFLDGKASKKSVVLSTGAVVQKANDARLVDVRLPSYAGGSNDLALTFEAPSTSTAPSLRVASDRAKPAGLRLAGFRVALDKLPTKDATRLDSVSVRTKEGSASIRAFAFDVPSSVAPAFQSWLRKPAARAGAIEYVSPTGDVVLGVKVDSCTPTSVSIDGPATHVALVCARARGL